LRRTLLPLVLTFFVSGTQVSTTPSCPLPALVSDARKQADSMAAAAGMRAGPIVSVSDQPAATALPDIIYGHFSAAAFLVVNPFPSYIAPQSPSCSLTVQFKLL
jgi:uncharacterized protein YggE